MNYYGLAGCYFYSGRPHEAIEILRRRIETAPESWQAYVALHDFHVLLGQVDQGIRLIYEGSKRAAPAFAQQFLARDYLILDDEPSAKRAWSKETYVGPSPTTRRASAITASTPSSVNSSMKMTRMPDSIEKLHPSGITQHFDNACTVT